MKIKAKFVNELGAQLIVTFDSIGELDENLIQLSRRGFMYVCDGVATEKKPQAPNKRGGRTTRGTLGYGILCTDCNKEMKLSKYHNREKESKRFYCPSCSQRYSQYLDGEEGYWQANSN